MAVALVVTQAGVVQASGLERLVMPGPVARAHAEYEADCAKCHDPFQPRSERRLCLNCHEEIAADVDANTGYHGRVAHDDRSECRTCHGEHLGRGADIVGRDPQSFDHDATDFPLRGGHVVTPCTNCHEHGSNPRDAATACAACHSKSDLHRGRLGRDCAFCHDVDGWERGRFDHSDTAFPLFQAHATASCGACHPDQRYEDTPTTCYSCHRLDDMHQGRRGRDCAECHGEERWDTSRFDHDIDTHFPLRDRHALVECESCHRGVDIHAEIASTCRSCHARDDVHRGKLGETCESCHAETGWRMDLRFDHDTGEFPLIGLHVVAPCDQCHASSAYTDTPKDCASCHASDDIHAQKLGRDCAGCHTPNGWAFWSFDHDDKTRFPLEGAHAGLACEGCHTAPDERMVELDARCIACHRADDVHAGAYGTNCARCHSADGFLPARMGR